ncbi:MAG: HepT-like ribonuclease domain-containing protein [Bacteroidota bacterium]
MSSTFNVQAAIDLAAHIVASEGLGIPKDLRDNFRLLQHADIIAPSMAEKMQKMVGFRNIAVHEYQNLDSVVLKSILVSNLRDVEDFYSAILKHFHIDER